MPPHENKPMQNGTSVDDKITHLQGLALQRNNKNLGAAEKLRLNLDYLDRYITLLDESSSWFQEPEPAPSSPTVPLRRRRQVQSYSNLASSGSEKVSRPSSGLKAQTLTKHMSNIQVLIPLQSIATLVINELNGQFTSFNDQFNEFKKSFAIGDEPASRNTTLDNIILLMQELREGFEFTDQNYTSRMEDYNGSSQQKAEIEQERKKLNGAISDLGLSDDIFNLITSLNEKLKSPHLKLSGIVGTSGGEVSQDIDSLLKNIKLTAEVDDKLSQIADEHEELTGFIEVMREIHDDRSTNSLHHKIINVVNRHAGDLNDGNTQAILRLVVNNLPDFADENIRALAVDTLKVLSRDQAKNATSGSNIILVAYLSQYVEFLTQKVASEDIPAGTEDEDIFSKLSNRWVVELLLVQELMANISVQQQNSNFGSGIDEMKSSIDSQVAAIGGRPPANFTENFVEKVRDFSSKLKDVVKDLNEKIQNEEFDEATKLVQNFKLENNSLLGFDPESELRGEQLPKELENSLGQLRECQSKAKTEITEKFKEAIKAGDSRALSEQANILLDKLEKTLGEVSRINLAPIGSAKELLVSSRQLLDSASTKDVDRLKLMVSLSNVSQEVKSCKMLLEENKATLDNLSNQVRSLSGNDGKKKEVVDVQKKINAKIAVLNAENIDLLLQQLETQYSNQQAACFEEKITVQKNIEQQGIREIESNIRKFEDEFSRNINMHKLDSTLQIIESIQSSCVRFKNECPNISVAELDEIGKITENGVLNEKVEKIGENNRTLTSKMNEMMGAFQAQIPYVLSEYINLLVQEIDKKDANELLAMDIDKHRKLIKKIVAPAVKSNRLANYFHSGMSEGCKNKINFNDCPTYFKFAETLERNIIDYFNQEKGRKLLQASVAKKRPIPTDDDFEYQGGESEGEDVVATSPPVVPQTSSGRSLQDEMKSETPPVEGLLLAHQASQAQFMSLDPYYNSAPNNTHPMGAAITVSVPTFAMLIKQIKAFFDSIQGSNDFESLKEFYDKIDENICNPIDESAGDDQGKKEAIVVAFNSEIVFFKIEAAVTIDDLKTNLRNAATGLIRKNVLVLANLWKERIQECVNAAKADFARLKESEARRKTIKDKIDYCSECWGGFFATHKFEGVNGKIHQLTRENIAMEYNQLKLAVVYFKR